MTLARILGESEARLLDDERAALTALHVLLARSGVTREDEVALEASVEQLSELFLIVVAGEFNAGKSAFVNALVGETVLEEGVTPTTSKVTLVRHEGGGPTRPKEGLHVVHHASPVLESLHIVDTPGTNAIEREHERLTREFLPQSDLVLFVTSADRPFTESEREFLTSIRDWGKKVCFVVNKVDILDNDEDVAKVTDFVRDNARQMLGAEAPVFPLSAKQALAAKRASAPEALERCGFTALEDYVESTLDERERLRLKLANPLGVGRALVDKYRAIVRSELRLLKDDVTMLEDVDGQLDLYERDQSREFGYRLSDIDNALLDFESRGQAFFEETLRLGRVFDLVNRSKVKMDFERTVVADLPQTVEKRVESVIDWMVESELEQWKSLVAHLETRRKARDDRMVGSIPAAFEQDRKRLLQTVGEAAKRAIDGYDRDEESTRLAQSVQNAVASTAVLEVSALGLGALVAAIATTTAADVTGILAASALSVVGLLVLPAKKRRAKAELNAKIAEVRRDADELADAAVRDRDAREPGADPRRHRPVYAFRPRREGAARGGRRRPRVLGQGPRGDRRAHRRAVKTQEKAMGALPLHTLGALAAPGRRSPSPTFVSAAELSAAEVRLRDEPPDALEAHTRPRSRAPSRSTSPLAFRRCGLKKDRARRRTAR